MAGLWYRTGSVAVTQSSKKITGTDTSWLTALNRPSKGNVFYGPDGKAYEIDYISSETELYLVDAYAGAAATGQSYKIDVRGGTVPELSRQLSEHYAYMQGIIDSLQSIVSGSGDVTITGPDGKQVTIPALANMLSKSGNLAGLTDKVVARSNLGGVATTIQDGFMSKEDKVKLGNIAEYAAAFDGATLPDVTIPFNSNLNDSDGRGVVSFSRASSATYVNKNGQLQSVGQDVPRFEADGLLIEPGVTNYTTGQLTNPSPQGDAIMSPLGRVVYRQGDTTYQTGTHPPLPSGSTVATFSVFVNPQNPYERVRINPYQPGGSNTQCDFVCATGKVFIGGTDTEYANGGVERIAGDWYRVWFTLSITGGTLGVIPHFYHQQVNNPCAFDGVQLELLPYMTSYVPTNGAAVTRAPDLCSADISRVLTPGMESEFTISAEVGFLRTGVLGAAHAFRIGSSANEYVWVRREANNSSWISSCITPTLEKDAREKVGVVCTRCGPGNMRFSIGDKSAMSTTALKHADFANFFIGNVTPEETFMHIRNFRIWHRGLTDTQIKGLR